MLSRMAGSPLLRTCAMPSMNPTSRLSVSEPRLYPTEAKTSQHYWRLPVEFGEALRDKNDPHVFVFRSTMLPGTVEDRLIPLIEQKSGKLCNVDFDVCYQPEFLREGSSIKDYDHPPFTIIGTQSDRATTLLREIFGHLPCNFQITTVRAAEMIKFCCNTFHALKITFANEVARLCEALKLSPFEVMDLVCQDRNLNISPAYLRPGFAFGGSCLPKDLRALTYVARQNDVSLPMVSNILRSNQEHVDHAVKKILSFGERKVSLIRSSVQIGNRRSSRKPASGFGRTALRQGVRPRHL